jgi:hypothetical protein
VADSIQTLGSVDVFPFLPNFKDRLTNKFVPVIDALSFPGTSIEVDPVLEKSPLVVSCSAMFETKAELNTFLTFVDGKFGPLKCFWYYMQTSHFKMIDPITSGADRFVTNFNYYGETYKTVDRIFIRKTNGDLIVRRVTAATDDLGDMETTIEVTPTIDLDIAVDEVDMIGRVLYVRFDIDTFRIKNQNANVSTTSFRLNERVKEYPAT